MPVPTTANTADVDIGSGEHGDARGVTAQNPTRPVDAHVVDRGVAVASVPPSEVVYEKPGAVEVGRQHRRPSSPHYRCSCDSSTELREKSAYVWRTLGYLVVLNPFLSLFNSFYAVLLLALYLPATLLGAQQTFVTSRLTSHLLLHLRFLHPAGHTALCGAARLSTKRLILMHVFSPTFAIPLSLAASVVAFLWIYTEILLGDKNERMGVEYRSFLWVRRRWETYVLMALEVKSVPHS